MRTELEKHLNRLEAPVVPQDLKARCMSTIPFEGMSRKVTPKKSRPFLLRPIAVAGTLMFAAVAGVAFWSTRPSSDGTSAHSGSVAFAEVLEAARQVPFFHAKGYELGPAGSGDKLSDELWYDAAKGRYSQSLPLSSRQDKETLPLGASSYNRTLMLPDGTFYYRERGSSTVFVGSSPNNWKAASEPVLKILTGNTAGTKDLSGATFGRVLSSTMGNWKGQEAQILVLERQPSPSHAALGIGPVQARLYVNPKTKLVVALQDFSKKEDGSLKLFLEYEFDYSSPDPELFKPKIIQQGAESHSLNSNHSLSMPWAPKN